VGGWSGRSVFLLGGYGILSARKRPLLALLDGGYRVVVQLAGDTRRRRFLTASSKASQNTSGRWRGRQGEQSPRASGDVILLLQPGAVGVCRVRCCCRQAGAGMELVCGAGRRRLTLGKAGVGSQGGALCASSEQGKEEGRNERKKGRSLLSSTAQGHLTTWKASLRAGKGLVLWLGAVRKCGRRDSKKRVAGRGQKSADKVLVADSTAENRKKGKRSVRSCVVRASSAWPCRFLRQESEAVGVVVSLAPLTSRVVDRRLWGFGCPTSFRGQAADGWHSPLPQRGDGLGCVAQNERRWKQRAWLLAQGILGLQWLKTRDQSPTVNRLLELLIFGRWVGFAEDRSKRAQGQPGQRLQRSGDGASGART
jgi:hypothetical protein